MMSHRRSHWWNRFFLCTAPSIRASNMRACRVSVRIRKDGRLACAMVTSASKSVISGVRCVASSSSESAASSVLPGSPSPKSSSSSSSLSVAWGGCFSRGSRRLSTLREACAQASEERRLPRMVEGSDAPRPRPSSAAASSLPPSAALPRDRLTGCGCPGCWPMESKMRDRRALASPVRLSSTGSSSTSWIGQSTETMPSV
mmetsp:Transcript_36208/g.102039  ORF Transcript_36208/g.102039 Transcript_36208/m.102039 type:complete len:201 (+) Transcript_36208:1667-2269(+)